VKEIKTYNFKQKQADLIEHPPVVDEKEDVSLPTKKKKYIYQLNKWIDVVD